MKMKKTAAIFLSAALAICLLAALVPVRAAEAESSAGECTVVGADLTNAQTEEVYALFGIPRGSVPELSMTNAEERSWLEGYVEESVIGTASLSSVYITLLPEGSGTEITTHNVTWCDEAMYRSALETAGITDVRAVIAAPFPVSGTAALAGIYKAYESLTGKTLDDIAKQAGFQQLITSAGLAGAIGSVEAAAVVDDVRSVLDETKDMTDEELSEQIRSLAADHGIKLNDYQVRQLVNLCRSMEKLSDSELVDKIEDLQNTAQKLEEMNDKAQEARQTVNVIVDTVKGFITRVGDFFSGLFGKK